MDSMQTNGIFEMKLETIENAIAMETIDTSLTRSIKVLIPKLMPLSKSINPVTKKLYLNKSNILNSDSNFPKIEYNTSISNFIKVPIASKSYLNCFINKGQKLYILLPNKNIDMMKVVEF